MNPILSTLKLNDQVKVKQGIKDPETPNQSISGWQGEVTEIDKVNQLIEVKWDTQTLAEIPDDYLQKIINQGYDHERMTLHIDELEMAYERPFSSEEKRKLDAKIFWFDLYEDQEKNLRYAQLFSGIPSSDEWRSYQKWEEYLSDNLDFPFEVQVAESTRGGLKYGTKIKLLDLEEIVDMYGILAIGKVGRSSITTTLCDLEATDKKSKNYELLRDYVIWFANR